jgi:hypothetical protein
MDIDYPVPTSRKRKAASSFSTNPHTIKARKRIEKLSHDPIRSRIEKAKAADQGAVTYAKSKLVKSEQYLNASADLRAGLVQDCEAKIRLRRYGPKSY